MRCGSGWVVHGNDLASDTTLIRCIGSDTIESVIYYIRHTNGEKELVEAHQHSIRSKDGVKTLRLYKVDNRVREFVIDTISDW